MFLVNILLNLLNIMKLQVNKDELDDEYNIPKEILEQFNKNSKNFFKVRKDIVEQPGEEEEEPINEK